MQVIRPGFPCKCGLNARWTRALVRRLSIPVKSGDMHDQAASPMSGGCSCVSTLDLDLFFLDVLDASCCGKSDIRILAVNSSISGMRVPRDKGRMPKMKRFQRTKGLSARAFEGPGSTQSQIDKMNEKADLHRHDRVQWHVNPKSCYSDPRRRSDTCRVMMRQWEAREGRKS